MTTNPLIASYNSTSVFFITANKLLNLVTYCRRKVVIEGRIAESAWSGCKCSFMTLLFIKGGRLLKLAIVARTDASGDT